MASAWISASLVALAAFSASCSGGSLPSGGEELATLGGGSDLTTDGGTTFYVVGPVGGPFPNAQRSVPLANQSPETIRWRAESTLPWLQFSEQEGELAPGQRGDVVVSIDQGVATGLPAGEYAAEITFRNAASPSDQIAIDFLLTVDEAGGRGMLAVTPDDSFEASGEIGGELDRPTMTYRMANVGAQPLRYSVTTSDAWVTFSGETLGGLDPGATQLVTVGFDQDLLPSLGEGRHVAWIEFTNTTDGAGSTRRMVELNLTGGGRVTQGLLALYTFDEGSGVTVRDESGVGVPIDLTIATPGAVQWLPGALRIVSSATVASLVPALKISQACSNSGEITVEAWVEPANVTQEGPARIVTLSGGLFQRNFALSQGQYDDLPNDVFDVRVRTTSTDQNGIPAQQSPQGSAKKALTHVLFTRQASGTERIFVNGALVRQAEVAGAFSGWDLGYLLTIGNEVTGNRPWLGTLHLVSIYRRALSAQEVEQNYDAGTQDPGVGHLSVTPAGDYVITGTQGRDDFAPLSKTYTLTNTGNESLAWRASVDRNWVAITSSSSGTLAPGATRNVTLELDEERAKQFAPGTYNAVASFTNETTDFGSATRQVRLTVADADGGGGGSGEKPGPHNTGPYDESLLEPCGSLTITQSGAVIENVDVSGHIEIKASNVTVRNFRVRGGGSLYGIKMTDGKTGILLEDGEVRDVDSAGIYGGGFTARRLEVHESGTDAIKTTHDAVVEYCWLHHLGTNEEAHADGNQTRQGSHFVFRGNNFDIPASVPAPYKSNANLIIQTAEGPISDCLVEENWLNGGNFTVYFTDKGAGYGDPQNCRLINNRFGRDYRYGVLYKTGYVYASGNVWDDTGELMDINNN